MGIGIYAKLLEMQKRVVGLGKDTKSFGYQYVSGGKVLENLKPIMNDVGLLLKQEIINVSKERIDYSAKAGSKSEMWYGVTFKFTWIDVETGDKDENLFYASGMNDWEKGLGSALTYAERYFLLKFFHINTDEDDIDNPDRKGDFSQRELNEEDDFSREKCIELINNLPEELRDDVLDKYRKATGSSITKALYMKNDYLKKVWKQLNK